MWWHILSEELPLPNTCLLTLSKIKDEDSILAKGITYYLDIEHNGNYKFYTNGVENRDIVYWDYFPELPKG